ncbi:MAG TPA: hypothetical protein PKK33_06850, partial [Candidatus Cloacimonadota bacterium]|nr:hypothetical protein [Candidatus Cloacimonadota bacterium]
AHAMGYDVSSLQDSEGEILDPRHFDKLSAALREDDITERLTLSKRKRNINQRKIEETEMRKVSMVFLSRLICSS